MGGWNSRSKIRKKAIREGFKSGFESKIAKQLVEHKIPASEIYEITTIPYIVPESKHNYRVDFTLPNGILIESKGRWEAEDRKKHLLIKEQHPELDIRIVFVSAKTRISKNSKTTYGQFCDKHGIVWAEKEIPKEWLK